MKLSDNNAVRLTAATMALAFTLAGCGSDDDSAAGSSSSEAASASSTESSAPTEEATPAAADADYSALLMSAEDFPDLGVPFIAEEPLLNPNGMEGVAQLFHTPDKSAMIGDTIVFLADPAEAANVLAKATESLGTSVTGAPQPSPIGTNGTFATGTSPDGRKGVAVLLFTNDNAFVTIQFDSADGDLEPAPVDYVESVGQLQLDALQAG